jgi:hypothetical protein
LFAPLFDDNTVIVLAPPPVAHSPGPRSRYPKVHDRAIALALLLCDQDPFEYGFAYAKGRFQRENGRPVIASYEAEQFGFSDEKEREAAHKKAKAFLGRQLKDKEPPAKGAKHWPRFAGVIGDDAASRALFDLIASEPKNLELLGKAEAEPDGAAKLYFDRRDELNARVPRTVEVTKEYATRAEIAGWMYLGTFPKTGGTRAESKPIRFLPGHAVPFWDPGYLGLHPFALELYEGRLAVPLRELVVAWAANRVDDEGLRLGLYIAQARGLKGILPAARRVVDAKADAVEHHARAVAMGLVARYGEPAADVPRLLKHAGDETPFSRVRVPDGEKTVETQLRDVAVSMAVKLAGGDPRDFGFLWPCQVGGAPVADPYDSTQVGFATAADRTDGHAKAKQWLDRRPKKEGPKPDPAVRKLVEWLGAEEFADREAAEKELRKLGFQAEAALKDGLKSESPEVRERAAKLLDATRTDLLGGKDSPVWAKFKSVAGDDADAWKLYLRATGTRARAEMLLNAVNDPKAAAASYAKECKEIATVVNHGRASGVALPPKPPGFPDRDVTPDDLAALLFLGTLPRGGQTDVAEEPGAVTSHVLHAALAAETKKSFARLYAAWAESRPDYYSTALNIGLGDRVGELAGVARKALAVKDRPSWAGVRGPALQFLGLHGTADDVALVMKFAGDKAECGKIEFSKIEGGIGPFHPAVKNTDVVVQVRDVAFIAALRLHRQKPGDFGFEQAIVQDGGPPPAAHWLAHLGFCRDADREAAHAKAKDWLDKQKK